MNHIAADPISHVPAAYHFYPQIIDGLLQYSLSNITHHISHYNMVQLQTNHLFYWLKSVTGALLLMNIDKSALMKHVQCTTHTTSKNDTSHLSSVESSLLTLSGLNFSEAELIQNRSPDGVGPSSKTWPRWAPHYREGRAPH